MLIALLRVDLLLLAAALALVASPAAGADSAGDRPASKGGAAAARQEQRVALVIGNGAYKDAPLTNPANDAKAMAAALKEAGFSVALHTDIDQRTMLAALRDFGTRLRQGGVGVFYFAGHGMQIKGRNYLIPIGADIQREDEVAYQALDAQAVLDKMETAGNGTNLVILDACRNNPFARSFRSSTQGLAQMDAPVGTLVAFATAPGSVASDGQSANGLYTQHLLTAMRQPGAKVEDVFKQVRSAVRRDSQGKQVPWEATSLEGDLYFFAPVATPPVDAAAALDEAMWDVVKGSADTTDLRAYLHRFPQGRHAGLAAQQLAKLTPPASAPARTPVQPAPAAAEPVMPARQVDNGRDARTAEVLAELSRPAAKPTVPQTAPQTARKPASNAFGFTVGDRWNYQVVDRWRGEVVRNYGVRILRMDSDGAWHGGNDSLYDALGRLVQWTNGTGERRQMKPYAPRWWEDMKVGDRRTFEYEESWSSALQQRANRCEAEGRVLGQETVKVPAGEFQAMRIEFRGTSTAIGAPGRGNFTVNVWYVPALHTWVAMDVETTWNGHLDRREREELTSYTLVNTVATN